VTRRRTTAAVTVGAAAAAGLALAGPILDRLVGRVERRLSPLTAPPPQPSERALALHATLRAVDLHADSLLFGRDLLQRGDRGHLDVPRMIEGGVALQVFSAAVKSPRHLNIERNDDRSDDVTSLALASRWPPRTWRSLPERALFLAGRAHRLAARSGGAFRLIGSREDLAAYLADRERDGRLTAGVLAIEGAHALGPDLTTLDAFVDAGFRMISPAHFFDTAYGGSAHGIAKGGLTDLGRELVREMEARGLIVDVAHASSATIDEVVTMATRPMVASHTGVRAIADNGRNLTDDQLRGIAATGGLVGIGFWDTATGGRDAASIARSIVHAVSVIGADHVGLGSDWDGAVPVPFDAAGLPALTDALLEAGLDDGTIRAVMGENALRLFAASLPPAGAAPAL
jgi:microsomal dipeptidase-like Zn-dependent dipeptidase